MTEERLGYLNKLRKQIEILQKLTTYSKNSSEPKYLRSISLIFNGTDDDDNLFSILPKTIPNFDELSQEIFHFLECELQKLKKEFEEA